MYFDFKYRGSMKLSPFFAPKPWGGEFISRAFNLPSISQIGEAFLISTLANSETKAENDNLSVHLGQNIPYVVKIIDANQNLSIQVHPNDHWANLLEGSIGKTECWLILDSEPSAGIYYGFKEGNSFETLKSAIAKNENASDCLNFITVNKGDFIEVPAGTIHAIGAGVKVLEFQQSSGITYRIWDWGRVGRELHLEKAEKVTSDKPISPKVISFENIDDNSIFFKHSDFCLKKAKANIVTCFSEKSITAFDVSIEDFSCKVTSI
jgi:mannose-6-phosphate isomerase